MKEARACHRKVGEAFEKVPCRKHAAYPCRTKPIFTPWLLDGPLLVAGAVTALAVAFLWFNFRRGAVDGRALVMVGGLYGGFAWAIVACF